MGIVAGLVGGLAVLLLALFKKPAQCPKCGFVLPKFRKPQTVAGSPGKVRGSSPLVPAISSRQAFRCEAALSACRRWRRDGELLIQKRAGDYFLGPLAAADCALASSFTCRPRVFRRIFWRALRRRCSRDLSPFRYDIGNTSLAMLQHLSEVCSSSAGTEIAGFPCV